MNRFFTGLSLATALGLIAPALSHSRDTTSLKTPLFGAWKLKAYRCDGKLSDIGRAWNDKFKSGQESLLLQFVYADGQVDVLGKSFKGKVDHANYCELRGEIQFPVRKKPTRCDYDTKATPVGAGNCEGVFYSEWFFCLGMHGEVIGDEFQFKFDLSQKVPVETETSIRQMDAPKVCEGKTTGMLVFERVI